MAFAYGTQIATGPGTARPIETFAVDDPVLAASLRAGQLEWTERTVEFSNGVPPGKQAMMVRLVWGDGDDELVVTPDQLFLLAGGLLGPADRLLAGDQLIRADGEPAVLRAIEVGEWLGGIHDIATSLRFEGIDNHLISAMGIVAADFTLEIGHPSGATQP